MSYSFVRRVFSAVANIHKGRQLLSQPPDQLFPIMPHFGAIVATAFSKNPYRHELEFIGIA